MEFMTEGKLYKRHGNLYVRYDESEFSGFPGCVTTLKLGKDSVRMRRAGPDIEDTTVLEFEKGKRYRCVYATPFGPLELEVLTNSLENRIDENDKGTVDIDYNMSLKGVSEARNLLNIELK